MKPTTLTSSRPAVTKSWLRKGKRYFRSFFYGKMRQVPDNHYQVIIDTTDEERRAVRENDPWIRLLVEQEREKRRQQKAGWWCDWVTRKDRK